MSALDEYLRALDALPPAKRAEVVEEAKKATADRVWVPNPGPQTAAYFSEADEMLFGGEAGGGKALDVDTLIPTPTGWTRMGQLSPGDKVFDENGLPCNVVAVSPVMIGRPCFSLTFSDGAEIVADADHQWLTLTHADRAAVLKTSAEWRANRRAARASRSTGKKPWLAKRNAEMAPSHIEPPRGAIRTTSEIAATVYHRNRVQHSIPVAGPIDLAEADLPINPYLLGAWLGDGTARGARMTIAEQEVERLVSDAVASHGWEVTKGSGTYDYGIVGGLKVALRAAGVLANKHIPSAYLRASIAQRMALLQGLMDTDGYCDTRGQCEFTNTNERLALQTAELIRSLGCKAFVSVGVATLKGRAIGAKYRIKFMAPFPAFRLERKLQRQRQHGFRPTVFRRYIEAATPCASRPVKCIAVDSPSRLYLASENMIPTHNSDLGIGLALTAHQRSLVLRRTNKEAEKLFDRFEEIIGNTNGKNSQKGWRHESRIIDIGGCQLEADKQKRKGIPHDLKFFDELVDFSRTQYEFITTWTRSRDPNQRTRIVATTNPPTTPEGMWVVERWAPWLDPKHPKPAADGELRWFTAGPDGKEIEVDGRGPHEINGKQVFAKSRTFIRSKLADNPDLTQTDDYRATLDALPIELRAAYAEGRFDANLKDQALQAIPTDWIRAAMDRWQEKPMPHVPMCGMGVDASGGGTDPMVIAIRHDGWYAPNIRIPAKEIPSTRAGKHAAGIIVSYRRNQAVVVVDMGGGYGSGIYEALHDNDIKAVAYKGAEGTSQRTKDGQIKFTNIRTQAYWRFREALDPAQPGGSPIMLPFDPLVIADLAAPTFKLTPSGLALESKEKVCERLGRSTDDGDAIVMAWFAGPTYLTDGAQWATDAEMTRGLGRRPQTVMSGRRQPITGRR